MSGAQLKKTKIEAVKKSVSAKESIPVQCKIFFARHFVI